ncbi:MvdC/MvdD family ATP grasp protein [Nocardiopsis ansamitocini]|uniref:MvdD-like pre-ATP grasp domain-containing protein n=1 Tax=Nocardiopsis ansamitocini TaxID=1670832 RepID=A0A9W6UKE6_9ACTN|nr:hypothetical protein [Nocardiopsis ansamitocini]GLU48980.1 hypothetical protein Nans01_33310 [Nocardiopsis ansamitocini]
MISRLNERHVPLVRLDPGTFPHQVETSAEFSVRGMGGYLSTLTRELSLERVRAVYWRRASAYTAPACVEEQDAAWTVDQIRWGLGEILASIPGAFYVNHPWRNRDTEAKPAQLEAATRCGLTIPRTLITNVSDRARAFIRANAPAVYKTLWNSDYRASDGWSFMTARSMQAPPAPPMVFSSDASERPTEVGPGVSDDWAGRFVVQLAAPGATPLVLGAGRGVRDIASGSWALADDDGDGGWVVRQHGPVRLWDRIEEAVGLWQAAGRVVAGRWARSTEPVRRFRSR